MGTSCAVWGEFAGWAGFCHPGFVVGFRLLQVHGDVAVAVAFVGLLHSHRLMPAVHAGKRIGLDGEREILMDACIGPPDAREVGVARVVVGLDAA